MSNYTKRVVHGVGIIFIVSVITAIISYGIRLYFSRQLSQEEFGLFYAVFALVMLFVSVANLGIPYSLAKFIPEFTIKKRFDLIKGSMHFVLITQVITSGVIAGIIFLLRNQLAEKYFHTNQAVALIIPLAIVLFLALFEEFVKNTLQGFHKSSIYGFVDFTKMSLVLVGSWILFMNGWGVLAPVYAYLFSYILMSTLFMILVLTKVFPQYAEAKSTISKRLVQKLTHYGFPLMITMIGGIFITYTDTIFLTFFTDLKQVALYSAALPTAMLLWFFIRSVAVVTVPLIAEMKYKKHAGLDQAIQLLQKFALLLIIPPALTLVAYPDIVLRILFGETYTAGAIALSVLSAGGIMYTIAILNNTILNGLGKTTSTSKIMIIAAGLNIVLNLFLVPRYTIAGAAASTATSYLLMALLSSVELRKYAKVKPHWEGWVKSFIAGGAFLGVLFVLKTYLKLHYLLEALIALSFAAIVYIAFVWMLKITHKQELVEIKKQLTKRSG